MSRGNLAVKLLNLLPLDVCNAKKKESLVRSVAARITTFGWNEQVSNIKVGDSRVFDLKREPDVYARLLDDKPIIGDTETAFGMIPNICWEARRTWDAAICKIYYLPYRRIFLDRMRSM